MMRRRRGGDITVIANEINEFHLTLGKGVNVLLPTLCQSTYLDQNMDTIDGGENDEREHNESISPVMILSANIGTS